jgi:hypothetical protein
MGSSLRIVSPLKAPLRALTPEQLDVFQSALTVTTLESLFNNCPLGDIAIARAVPVLIDQGYFEVTPPAE